MHLYTRFNHGHHKSYSISLHLKCVEYCPVNLIGVKNDVKNKRTLENLELRATCARISARGLDSSLHLPMSYLLDYQSNAVLHCGKSVMNFIFVIIYHTNNIN